jgi:molybdate transport system substrate-binding protein
MERKMKRFLGTLLAMFLLSACQETDEALIVAVAANLSAPMREIATAYEATAAGQKTELVVASSGVLTAQIRNGAPFDLFLSADDHYPEVLAQAGLALQPPRIFTYGSLVLWTREPLLDSRMLDPAAFFAFAIAHPELAPYGLAAKNWLITQGKWDALSPKVIYGENVGQVNQYIRSGAVDGALTAVSATYAAELRDIGHWKTLAATDAPRIPHAGVLLKGSDEAAQRFWDFLFSPAARQVLESYGYYPPNP